MRERRYAGIEAKLKLWLKTTVSPIAAKMYWLSEGANEAGSARRLHLHVSKDARSHICCYFSKGHAMTELSEHIQFA